MLPGRPRPLTGSAPSLQEPLKQSLPGSRTQQEAADAFDPDLLVEGYEAYIESASVRPIPPHSVHVCDKPQCLARCDCLPLCRGTRGFLTAFTVQRHKRNYEQLLLQVMNQFNNFSESQLITGCVVEWDTMRKRRNGKRFDAKAHVVEATQGLREKYRRWATAIRWCPPVGCSPAKETCFCCAQDL